MQGLVKIVVTVPEADADKLRQVVGDAGGGELGNYSHSSFSSKGIGRFLPKAGAKPNIGEIGRPEQVAEERIEVTCAKAKLDQVVKAIRANHPYEEPVIDIYELLN